MFQSFRFRANTHFQIVLNFKDEEKFYVSRCFPSYFLGLSCQRFVNKEEEKIKIKERKGGGTSKMLSPEKLWKHVVTAYKVGGYSFKLMRANGDKQPTGSLNSRLQP